MPRKVWDEITYPFSNFNGATVEVWEWIDNFIPYFVMNMIIYSVAVLFLPSNGRCKRLGQLEVEFGVIVTSMEIWHVLKTLLTYSQESYCNSTNKHIGNKKDIIVNPGNYGIHQCPEKHTECRQHIRKFIKDLKQHHLQ